MLRTAGIYFFPYKALWEQGMPKEASAVGGGNPPPEALRGWEVFVFEDSWVRGIDVVAVSRWQPEMWWWSYHRGLEGTATDVGWEEALAVALEG